MGCCPHVYSKVSLYNSGNWLLGVLILALPLAAMTPSSAEPACVQGANTWSCLIKVGELHGITAKRLESTPESKLTHEMLCLLLQFLLVSILKGNVGLYKNNFPVNERGWNIGATPGTKYHNRHFHITPEMGDVVLSLGASA